jgi:P-type conjugative transfer protein TrbL
MTDNGMLTGLLNTMQAAFQVYQPQILLIGTQLLGVLAFLQMLYIAVEAASSHDLPHMLENLSVAFIKVGMVYVILTYGTAWGQAIINTGVQIGREVSGQSPNVLTPSGIWDMGLDLVGVILAAQAANRSHLPHLMQDLEIFLTQVAIALSWLLAALLYLLLLLEGAIAIVIGPIFIALGGFEGTAEALAGWAKTLVAIAVSIAALLCTVAAGTAMVQTWQNQLSANAAGITTSASTLILAAAQSIAFFYVVKHVASMSQGMIGRSVSGFGAAVLDAVGAMASSAVSSALHLMPNMSASHGGEPQSHMPKSTSSGGSSDSTLTKSDSQLLGIGNSATGASSASTGQP